MLFNGSALSNRSRINHAASGWTQGKPIPSNALGGMDVPDDDFGIGLQGVVVLGMTGRVILPLLPDLGVPARPCESPLVAEAFDRLKTT